MRPLNIIPNLTRLRDFFRDLPENFSTGADEFSESEANQVLRIIKAHIERQDLPWAPLSGDYLQMKRDNPDLSEGVWEATRELYDALRVYKQGDAYYVGAGLTEEHPEHPGVLINDIIKYLEYGTKNTPARPLFVPSQLSARRGRALRATRFMFRHLRDSY